MKPLKLEQSDALDSTNTENETTKTKSQIQRTATKQRMKPLRLEHSDAINSNKTGNETTKIRQSDIANSN